MPKNLFNRYIWIVDTIRRHGAITREELNRLWMDSSVSDGNPLPRRTFYNYRNAISELFKIDIECNPSTFEYYIDGGDPHAESVTDWMLNTASLSNVLTDARDVAHRVFLEEVPSARQFLSPIISAMKEEKTIEFDYSPFSRTGVPKPVRLEPYFLKIFKLRWYITGLNVREKTIKTYAPRPYKRSHRHIRPFRHAPRFRRRSLFPRFFRNSIHPWRDEEGDNTRHSPSGQIFPSLASPSYPERDDP